ncbi:methyltransferase [Skermania sp. ID1734]|uniref:HemK2/MTQ2 family protein methyltransferase n=1 Tax=Skermania sp. ID1734 TaxID=2597516 RepID=UPI00117C85F3|nr:HemK2/MTQ2 family protein methyltransferase [Skermania sp. ID1734]TSD99587.1 methyltransferase [Skermania sp. ID1734]
MYRPQEDTRLLAAALAEASMPAGARVLDLCTGTGALALCAARLGAESVAAVDISRRACGCARLNARVHRLPVDAHRGGLEKALDLAPFDVVVSNPPYVPCGRATEGMRSRRWDAGPDGRFFMDPLCERGAELLRPGGFMLIVQSEFTGEDQTLRQLRAGGLKAAVVARSRIPFGPVLRRRASYLCDQGLCQSDCTSEELVVIRADKPSRPR